MRRLLLLALLTLTASAFAADPLTDAVERMARVGRSSSPSFSPDGKRIALDRKSTRLNSSHSQISYAVFCLKKKKEHRKTSELPHRLVPTQSVCARHRHLPPWTPSRTPPLACPSVSSTLSWPVIHDVTPH